MKKLFLISLCAFVLVSCSSSPSRPIISTPQKTPTAEISPTPSPSTKTYTSTEVAQHTTKNSCWLILDNGVYDVTSYISRHPGGDKILRGCGKDATQMFAKHPDSAKALKEQFKIGDLAQ